MNSVQVDCFTVEETYWQRKLARLTDKQKECLLWHLRGKSSTETATILNVDARTVRYHLRRCLERMDLFNMRQMSYVCGYFRLFPLETV